jgi:tetratricopeptide (TPR) repeat protein
MSPRVDPLRVAVLILMAGLSACAGKRTLPGDDAPTLKSLAGREINVAADAGIATSEVQAIAAYRKFLDGAPNAPQRAEAMRRLGDLEMDRAELGVDGVTPDYKDAVARYEEFLKSYPKDPGNDRVLYQLARAHEQRGALEVALTTLDRLVQEYPQTAYRDEAFFRRGELLFTTREYAKAEKSYATVLQADDKNPYRERALYMQGWSIFKQGRLEDSLHPFFSVLDLKLGGREGTDELDKLDGLTRADRELVEDTFRVTSLSLTQLQGAESIPAYMNSDLRRGYEFRVYQQLGELYLKQDRTKDAADTFALFARRNPLHAQAPQLQARVIKIYQGAGFATLALDAKKDYVARYGVDSEFRRANAAGWERAQPLVKTHLTELAQHYHASAQKSKASADYQEAVRWYRAYIASFPADSTTAKNNFLLAELLYEDSRFAEAAVEYEKVAYAYPHHERSADAGYAALLGHAAVEKRANATELPALQRTSVESALRFAQTFPADARTGAVLTTTAEKLYALNDGERAAAVAKQVLALNPPATATERRTAWTVIAHTAFERGAFADAEKAYADALALTPEQAPGRGELVERQAASIYKQGEQARAAGEARDAVAHFARVGSVAPQSAVRATAQYDAAAALIGLKDWAGATRELEDFRQRYPKHPLQGDVSGKLAVAYLEQQQWAPAAQEFERLAATQGDPALSRSALWQAAELHEKAGARPAAVKAYERYLQPNSQWPALGLEPSLEARWRLARIAKDDKQRPRELTLTKQIFDADQAGGAARTPRTRTLGAMAALTLAEPVYDGYAKVTLTEPLAKQLKLKKTKMEEVLKAYAVAADYGVAEVVTATTYQTAALYQDFGRALIGSQRPKGLKKVELEQYNVMLEEQAFPFEEKAIQLHEANAARTAQGLYDEWVRRSFGALATLRPVRYGKIERSEGSFEVASLEKAVAAGTAQPLHYNQLGIAYRQQGKFKEAGVAYEKALELDPAYAAPTLNLAILYDLYLGERDRALLLYERYLALAPGEATVTKWVADLKNRKPAMAALSKKE